jgi:hypothetical protein
LAEHVLGKDEVTSSILVIGSIRLRAQGETDARYGEMSRRSVKREGGQSSKAAARRDATN